MKNKYRKNSLTWITIWHLNESRFNTFGLLFVYIFYSYLIKSLVEYRIVPLKIINYMLKPNVIRSIKLI